MILVIGEVLTDIFPEYRRIGGAPFNFCFHLRRMGFDARFAGRLGDDEEGSRIRRFMQTKGIADDMVQRDTQHPTGVVYVELDEKADARFEIVEDVAYDYLEPVEELQRAAAQARMIYFGTLMQRTERGCETMQRILECRGSSTVCFYDINLRPGARSPEALRRSLENTTILKLNEEELHAVRDMFDLYGGEDTVVQELMHMFALEMVACTRAGDGSSLFTRSGRFDAQSRDIAVVDTVGAGDAYAAVVAAGYLLGLSEDVIVRAAARFAGNVCAIPGAIPDGDGFYDDVAVNLKGE